MFGPDVRLFYLQQAVAERPVTEGSAVFSGRRMKLCQVEVSHDPVLRKDRLALSQARLHQLCLSRRQRWFAIRQGQQDKSPPPEGRQFGRTGSQGFECLEG